MKITDLVQNDIQPDEDFIWVLKDHKNFAYSDGVSIEKYLSSVYESVDDLSSGSTELEKHIKDWASEYHLSAKRAQLLSCFDYEQDKLVLEVGCGCGAITRFLGERFNKVISIEGSIARAKLAKQRTKDQENIDILCAPFQKIKFKTKFDIIFCIGVFEYSGSFVEENDPYKAVLQYFSELLTDNGVLVLAIENQFGLKYFTSSREDHVGMMFEGIEGYHKVPSKVKTFGKTELQRRLSGHFNDIQFYYPFSDIKYQTA